MDFKKDWHNYHSLILTSLKLNLEVTDVFFENTSAELDLAKKEGTDTRGEKVEFRFRVFSGLQTSKQDEWHRLQLKTIL